jgi:hypothetical protein
MKVFVKDARLRRHSVDVDEGASVAHLKLLLANMSLVPAGFVPNLVYQTRNLNDGDCVGGIRYSPDLSISLVCVRAAPASAAAEQRLKSLRPSDANPPAAVQADPASLAAAAGQGGAAAQAAPAAADVSALSDARPVNAMFSMGFDGALMQRALAQAGGSEQGAIDILVSGHLPPDETPSLSSSRDAPLPVIFSMGFDDAMVRRALASAGGDEERAVHLLLSEDQPSSDDSAASVPDTSAAAAAHAAIRSSSGSIYCPQGHACFLWTYGDEDHACDLRDDSDFAAACRGNFEVGDDGYRCDVCDYDMCLQCYSALAAAAPALTGANPPAAAQTASTPSTAAVREGSRVRIECLQAKPEMNGRAGVVRGGCNAQSGRWTVEVAADEVGPACLGTFRPANLCVIEECASSAPPSPAVNVATEWLDENGCVCPKAVDYASQCPKGHALAPFADGGCGAAEQHVICRICHTHAGSEQVAQWLMCSVSGCCAGYAVCDGCVRALHQAPASVVAGEGFSSQVNRAARAASVLWLTSAAAGRLAAVLALDARAVWRVARPADNVAV